MILKIQMKTTAIVGIAAAAIGLVIGSLIPKSGTSGYAVITGTTKNREAAKEYFQKINQFTKECGFTILVRDLNTDIREGNEGPLTVIARHPKGKDAVKKCYESEEYQRLKAIRTPYTDWNFRITEGKNK
tara:strand:+ start:109 stop:498 length:390 start_codon:yes stop_codon:yes gene_type:complete